MDDLFILEAFIAGLLLLYLVRPYVRTFHGVEGFSAFPGIAVALCAASYPSFGFRPELVPLAVLSVAAFFSSLPRLADIALKLRTDDYGEGSRLLSAAAVALLAGAFVFAAAFAPAETAAGDSGPAARLAVADESRGAELTMLLEGAPGPAGEASRPLVVFAPPALGSADITRGFRKELAAGGYAVLSFVRKGLDFPGSDEKGNAAFPGFRSALDSLAAVLWGDVRAFAAEAAVRQERERLDDLGFVLDYVRTRIAAGDERFAGIDGGKPSLIGFGAGGAAALLFAASEKAGTVRSVVAVEAPVRSYLSLESEAEARPETEGAGFWRRLKGMLEAAGRKLRGRRVLGPDYGDAEARSLRVPTLLILSDWANDVAVRDARYAVLVRLLRSADASAALVSVLGAGPLDFSDAPEVYPAYAFFARGKERPAPGGAAAPVRAARIAVSFLEDASVEAAPDLRVEKKD